MANISSQIENRIGWVSLNRPEKRNALNRQTVDELTELLTHWKTEKEVKVIVIKGEGKAFCSGADLDSLEKMQDFTRAENEEDSQALANLFYLIYSHPKIVIAQIEGHALAGGMGLATICDFSFTVPDNKVGYTEVKIGFVPAIVMVFLIHKIGDAKARKWLLTGQITTGKTAVEEGLLTYCCSPESIQGEVLAFAEKLVSGTSEQGVAMSKELMNNLYPDLKEHLKLAAQTNALARESEDCKKGIHAFLNKQAITWN